MAVVNCRHIENTLCYNASVFVNCCHFNVWLCVTVINSHISVIVQ